MIMDPLDIAAAGGTVLTANKRLARQLVQQFDKRQISAGRSVWPSPEIFSLEAWLARLLHGRVLLTEAQSQYLWEKSVAADAAAEGRDLLQVSQTARRARDAHRLLISYLAEFSATGADEESLAFLRWSKSWQDQLERNGWLDRTCLLPAAIADFAGGVCHPPPALALAGFDDLPPALLRLCDILAACGCQVVFCGAPAVPDVKSLQYVAVDMIDEVRSCARWARLLLERAPHCRIGVVAPQLAEYQNLIERIFRAEFAPSSCLVGIDDQDAFTLSLGTPLSAEGVVCAALHLLAAHETLSIDAVGYLLRSPYLGGAQAEWADRARADRFLRQFGRCEWRLAALPRVLGGRIPRMAVIFASLLKAGNGQRLQLPGEWAEAFASLLESCGWPGERKIGSREYQAVDHFKEILGHLASLDLVAGPMERGEALAIVGRLAAETVFQTEGGEGCIQILGMLEAAGFTFDALWVLGLHERAFPAAPRPNPFLPQALQSRLRMPHADAKREAEFAQRLASRLFAAAPQVVASWPGQLDGAMLRPSPLIRNLPVEPLRLAPSRDPFQLITEAPCCFERICDAKAAPLASNRSFVGGTRILTDQALCPFRAFAHHRLHAESLAAADLGLDNLTRGNLVHGVLERFWRRIRTQDALLGLGEVRQKALLDQLAEETLTDYERRSRHDLPPRLRALELHRLSSTAAGWLAVERVRPWFRVVEIEQWQETVVGQLRLKTRIDRIDELAEGQLAIVDYKTGQPNPWQWLDERVTEPQLPLYCLNLDKSRIAAVLFAMIRGREKDCAFRGIARNPEAWPKLSASSQDKLLRERGLSHFDEVVDHWRKVLPALGDAFAAGAAMVDPVSLQQACQYCDLPSLCRIAERTGRLDADGGNGAVDE